MNITFFRPKEAQIAEFIEQERPKAFTYSAVGATAHQNHLAGYDNDYQYVVIGKGSADFEKARHGIRAWVHFPSAWTAIMPTNAPIKEGTVVAMFFRLFGLWWCNSCRIVYAFDEPMRYGFAYGTLPGHIESGEEVFWVEMDKEGYVGYGIKAFSKPKNWLVRLGYPFARMLQEKFRQDSAAAMRQYVSGGAPSVLSPNRWAWHILGFGFATALLWTGSMLGHHYGYLPLAFAFFLLVPFVWLMMGQQWPKAQIQQPMLIKGFGVAAISGILATMTASVFGSAILALPWLMLCIFGAGLGFRAIVSKTIPVPAALGLVYLGIGGAWFWADRAGLRPMGFGQDIVLLTALHFHFAGFALPVLTNMAVSQLGGRNTVAWAVALAVPLTAIGITATQFHLGPFIETLAAVVMSLSACLAAVYLLRWAVRAKSIAMAFAGLILLFTMALAFTYGIRAYWPHWAIDLDHMRAIHGSLNGLVAIPLAFWALWYHQGRDQR